MPAIPAISQVVSSLHGILGIVRQASASRDYELVRSKIVELNAEILDAQGKALEANAERQELVEKLRDVEKQLVSMTAWTVDKDRYELRQVSRFGSMAYVLKPDLPDKSKHYICATCYDQNRKTVLQGTVELQMRVRVYACAGCNSKIPIKPISTGPLAE